MLNLSMLLEDCVLRYPDNEAYVFNDTSLTFTQINSSVNKLANGLVAIGIKPGDKVAISCFNLPFFPIIYFGILKVGAVVVPLNVLLKKEEIAYHLEDADVKAYFCFVGTNDLPVGKMGHAAFNQVPSCERFFMIMPTPDSPSPIQGAETLGSLMADQSTAFDMVATSAEDTALIIYTSGTTGRPKGAELTHNNLIHNAILSAELFRTENEDVQLIVLPLFHIFAMTTLMNAGLYKGMKSILLPRFQAETVFALMEKHKVSVFAGVPTMYWGLLNYKEAKFNYEEISKNLKTAVSGGASLPVKVLEDFEERFKVNILEGYGMSEGSPVVTFNQIDLGCKAGSIGKPVWGVKVKLVDENDQEVPIGTKGELIFKGHNVMKGYYKRPEASAQALKGGWMHSGDIAIKDEDGFYYIVDRSKDIIIRGGLNIYPREIEEEMMKHEDVSLVAVIGIPNEQYGEEVKACVVLKEGANTSEQELITWIKERIAAYKYPRIIEFMGALPMSATGKILKKELRKKEDI